MVLLTPEYAYSEEDACVDSEKLFSQTEDFNVNWMRLRTAQTSFSDITAQEIDLYENISNYLDDARFLSFARQSLKSEILKHDSSLLLDAIVSSDSETTIESSGLELSLENSVKAEQLQFKNLNYSHSLSLYDILPLSLKVSCIRDLYNSSSQTLEMKMKQLKKDIERDRLIINGINILGSEKGLVSVLNLLEQIFDTIMTNCGLPLLSVVIKEELSLAALSKLSRTHSGGISFQALRQLLDNSNDHVIIPLSDITPPLKLNVFMGHAPKLNNNDNVLNNSTPLEWGVQCHVRCESLFKVKNINDVMNDEEEDDTLASESSTVQVIYEDNISFKINLNNFTSEANDVNNIMEVEPDSGIIHLKFI
eukprot:gene8690-11742_t